MGVPTAIILRKRVLAENAGLRFCDDPYFNERGGRAATLRS
jgi:hypothetical protein